MTSERKIAKASNSIAQVALTPPDPELVHEAYRDALEAHHKAKGRLKRGKEKVEDVLGAVLHQHINETLSDPQLLVSLGAALVKRQDLETKAEFAKKRLEAAAERYGAVADDDEVF